jgi:hypothetical protein
MTVVPENTERPETPEVPRRLSVPERLSTIAQRYAADGDVRRAQLASWAADVHVLEELMWQNGLAEAPDPVAQLAAVGESVASALEALADDPAADVTPRAVVEAARRAMVATFDESVHEVLLAQLPALDHLDACDPFAARPEGRSEESSAVRRLGPRTPEELVAELREAAADCVRVGGVMQLEGELTAANRMAHQADVATFEAYLVAAAVHAGDDQLATVDLRWELARELDPADWDAEGRDGNAFATLRRELISVVGSAEMETLWRTFETADEA